MREDSASLDTTGRFRSGPRGPAAARIFFPLAAAYALAILPASVLPMLGFAPALPGLASPAAHAHEMLFGFALLVVAGQQLGQPGARRLAMLLAFWVAARLSFLLAPQSILAALAGVGFATALATQVAPRLAASAKKWRNLALPAVIALLGGCAAAADLARIAHAARVEQAVLTVTVVAFSLLLLFMGGRFLAPAAAGQYYRQGVNLAARVQPRLEGALILVLSAAAAAMASATAGVAAAAGSALIAAGVVALVRLARWRLWGLRGRPDLACIGLGYAWVAIGLVAWGAALATGRPGIPMLHAITIGGLGTLTWNVMALTWARLARRDPAASVLPAFGTTLIAIACIARMAADFAASARPASLELAAACWSAAYALLLLRFAQLRTLHAEDR